MEESCKQELKRGGEREEEDGEKRPALSDGAANFGVRGLSSKRAGEL